MAYISTKEGRSNLFKIVAGVGGANLQVRLIKSPTAITVDTVLHDLVECDYDGYTPLQSASWIGPMVAPNGDEILTSPIFVFQHGNTPDTNTAYSYIITVEIGPDVYMLGGETFEVPYPMMNRLNQVAVPIVLRLRNLAA